MIVLLIGVISGGLISLIISHSYYKKSNVATPEWAKTFI